jgi:hypothetical protein
MFEANVVRSRLEWDPEKGAQRHAKALAGLRGLVHRCPDLPTQETPHVSAPD